MDNSSAPAQNPLKTEGPFSFTLSKRCLCQIEVGKSVVTVCGAQSSKGDKGPCCSLLPWANPSGLSNPWLTSECVTSGTPISRVCIPRCKQRLTAEPSSVGAVPVWVANITSPCPFSIKLPPQKTIRSRGCWCVAGLQQHSSSSAARLLSVLLCVFEGRLKKRETFASSWCLLAVWYLIALWGQPVSSAADLGEVNPLPATWTWLTTAS